MLKLLSVIMTVVTCLEVNMHRTSKIDIVRIDEKEFYNFNYGEYTTTIYIGTPP